jgi:flagellin
MPVINTNTAANSAVRYLNINAQSQSESLSKLASGSRINKASDDAAGLAIATRIKSDITALQQAATNSAHSIAILQTADGGASNISDILQRMKALASQSASGTVTDNERAYIDAEFQELIDEIDGIATGTRFNGDSLLDGTSAFAGAGITVMVGSTSTDTINLSIDDLDATALAVNASAVDTQTNANTALTALDAAIDLVSEARANIGAVMSRFEFRADTLATTTENLQASESAIRDVDVAAEQARLSAANVKTQAAVAAAAQANQMPQQLLNLLR